MSPGDVPHVADDGCPAGRLALKEALSTMPTAVSCQQLAAGHVTAAADLMQEARTIFGSSHGCKDCDGLCMRMFTAWPKVQCECMNNMNADATHALLQEYHSSTHV